MISAINDWQLSKKMAAAFSIVAALLLALGIDAVTTNRSLTEVSSKHVSRGLAGEVALSDALNQIREQRIIVYSYYNAMSVEEEEKLETRLAKSRTALMKAIEVYAPIGGESFTAQTAALRNAVATLAQVNDRIFAARRATHTTNQATLELIKGDGKDASHDALGAADLLKKMGRERSGATNAAGQSVAQRALLITAILMIVSLAMLASIWWLISRTVARPMAELAGVTTMLAGGGVASVPHRARNDELGAIARAVDSFRLGSESRAKADALVADEQQAVTTMLGEAISGLSDGDLATEIGADFPVAYASLGSSFNAALSSLRAVIGSVIESASNIRTGSEEIAQASEDLARRTEGNAASLEETSAALVQIDARLKATSLSSDQTVSRADQAIATVKGGRVTAEEAVHAMGRVSDSAKGIDSVIEGLDKIAFQTRVLAMNAAVEAGRAGDAGRGFAVVADLVSALAMRAEEEAKRARDQLTLTQTDIVAAVQAVRKVDGALANISGDVGEVHNLLGTMAADANAQSFAITEITAAISAMDQTTQQNAAMVEETSAAARNLTNEVGSLAEKAAMFKVDGAAARAQSVAVRAAPRSIRTKKVVETARYSSQAKALPVGAIANGALRDDWKNF